MGMFRAWHCESPHCGPLVPFVQSLSSISRWVQDILKRCEVQPKEDGDSFPETQSHTRSSEMPVSETDTVCDVSSPSSGLVSPSRTRYPYLVVAGDGKDVSGWVDSSRCRFVSRSRHWRSNSSSRIASHPWWPASSGHPEARADIKKSQRYDINDRYQWSMHIYRIYTGIYIYIISYP